MSRHPRHPYQSAATCGHVSVHPPAQPSTHHHHHHLRNPWAGEENHSQSTTNSSSSSRTYRGPVPPWLYNHHQPTRNSHNSHHVDAVIEIPAAGAGNPQQAPLLLPAQAQACAAAVVVPGKSSSRATSERDRPVTPASSPAGSGSGGAVSGCGGHCEAFDNFCYYCLQMVFVAGILTGVSLTIAGSVLRSQRRGGDLLVLVYIGVMVSMVCGVLLSVQCCVRRNVKRRRRALRRPSRQQAQHHHQQHAGAAAMQDGVPLQELVRAPPLLPPPPQIPQQQQQQPAYQPVRVLHQQPPVAAAVDNNRVPYHHHHHQQHHSRPVLCAAPGMTGVNSNEWLYRRVAQQGVNDTNIAVFESENLGTRLRYYHDI